MRIADNISNKATELQLDWFVGREIRKVMNKSNQEKPLENFNATVSK